jgi:hypothetical protein
MLTVVMGWWVAEQGPEAREVRSLRLPVKSFDLV